MFHDLVGRLVGCSFLLGSDYLGNFAQFFQSVCLLSDRQTSRHRLVVSRRYSFIIIGTLGSAFMFRFFFSFFFFSVAF